MNRTLATAVAAVCLWQSGPGGPGRAHAQVPAPEDVLGFQVGADRTLADWGEVVDYFWRLGQASDRVTVEEIGRSTLGRPLLMATISAPFNLMNLAKYRNLQSQAQNPAQLTDEDARLLARRGKAVVLLALNTDVWDVASSQMAITLAYHLATDDSEVTARLLENVIVLLIPSLDPDGLQALVDWYEAHLHTPAEGSWPPHLGHYYVGPELGRDGLMLNLMETQALARQVYRIWNPLLVYTPAPGPDRPRLLAPQFSDTPNIDLPVDLLPSVNRLSAAVLDRLGRQGLTGVASGTYGVLSWEHVIAASVWWRNRLGLWTASAGVQIATPLYYPCLLYTSDAADEN